MSIIALFVDPIGFCNVSKNCRYLAIRSHANTLCIRSSSMQSSLDTFSFAKPSTINILMNTHDTSIDDIIDWLRRMSLDTGNIKRVHIVKMRGNNSSNVKCVREFFKNAVNVTIDNRKCSCRSGKCDCDLIDLFIN
jgi:hypothetical protein